MYYILPYVEPGSLYKGESISEKYALSGQLIACLKITLMLSVVDRPDHVMNYILESII